MGKVISLKTGKLLGGNDYEETSEVVRRKGVYIGVLPLKVAKQIREIQQKLIVEQIQIDQLIEEFDEHYSQYANEINNNLIEDGYAVKSFNQETENLLIGEDGHMWIVKNSDFEEAKA